MTDNSFLNALPDHSMARPFVSVYPEQTLNDREVGVEGIRTNALKDDSLSSSDRDECGSLKRRIKYSS